MRCVCQSTKRTHVGQASACILPALHAHTELCERTCEEAEVIGDRDEELLEAGGHAPSLRRWMPRRGTAAERDCWRNVALGRAIEDRDRDLGVKLIAGNDGWRQDEAKAGQSTWGGEEARCERLKIGGRGSRGARTERRAGRARPSLHMQHNTHDHAPKACTRGKATCPRGSVSNTACRSCLLQASPPVSSLLAHQAWLSARHQAEVSVARGQAPLGAGRGSPGRVWQAGRRAGRSRLRKWAGGARSGSRSTKQPTPALSCSSSFLLSSPCVLVTSLHPLHHS